MSDGRASNAEGIGDGLQRRLDEQDVESFRALSLEENASSTYIVRSWGSKSKVKICQFYLNLLFKIKHATESIPGLCLGLYLLQRALC